MNLIIIATRLYLDAPWDDSRGNSKERQIKKKSSQTVVGTQWWVKKNGYKFIIYHYGGERGIGKDSWAEAEYLLIPN